MDFELSISCFFKLQGVPSRLNEFSDFRVGQFSVTLSLCVVFIAGPWQCELQKRVQHDRTLTQQVDPGQMALLIQRGTVAKLYRRLTGGIGFKFYQDRKVPDQNRQFHIGNLT